MRIIMFTLVVATITTASLRMRGLGTGFDKLVDDKIDDLLAFPQSGALSSDWLAAIEIAVPEDFRLKVRSPGPWSVIAAVDAELGIGDPFASPTLGVATEAAPWSFGVRATLENLYVTSTPSFYTPGDSIWGWAGTEHWEIGHATIGVRRVLPAVTIDGNVDVTLHAATRWVGMAPDTFYRSSDRSTVVITPRIRVTAPRGPVRWRGLVSYSHESELDEIYDSLGYSVESSINTDHRVGLAGGLTWSPTPNLLVTSGLRGGVAAYRLWSWNFTVPAGLEWTHGPLVVRLGADLTGGFTTLPWFNEVTTPRFYAGTYFGFSLRPLPRIRLDFLPSLDNVANLRAWHFGAVVDI